MRKSVVVITIVLAIATTVGLMSIGQTDSYSGSMKVLQQNGEVIFGEDNMYYYPLNVTDDAYSPSIEELEAIAKMSETVEGVYIMK